MRMDSLEDPWLLPSHQAEFFGRSELSEARLHRRRESTFLVLCMLFLVATAAMPILGASRIIDLAYAISSLVPGLSFAITPELPIGVLAFPISFLAINLVCELYGRRRANALLLMGLLASFALAGVMHLVDHLDGTHTAFGTALALTGCYFVAHVANLIIFDALRGRMQNRHAWLRKTASTVLSQIGGWAAFAFVMYGYAVQVGGQDSAAVIDAIVALAIGSALYVVAFAIVDVIPFAIAQRSLIVYLRIDTRTTDEDLVPEASSPGWAAAPRRLPKAVIVEEPSSPLHTPPTGRVSSKRRTRNSLQPFSSAEMRFFTEGEELAEGTADGEAYPDRAQPA
jgi:uncharacterized integral membrane protein (TIGR00697 family)